MTQGKPPPVPPPRAPSKAPPVPVPKHTRERQQLAQAAMRLRDEQLRARIVYVDPEVETNAELDEITARVVAELQALQRAGMKAKMPADPGQLEIELIKTFRELLEKMVSPRREFFLRHKVESIQRRIANLYLGSEVYTRPDSALDTVYAEPDEALLSALQRHIDKMRTDLESFRYTEPQIQQLALMRLKTMEKKLAHDVLQRSRPELERLLGVYRDVVLVFLMKDFSQSAGEFAWEVIREAQVARGHELNYKIREQQFPRFRTVFEQRFMERLLASVQEPLARRMAEEPDYDFRKETLKFAADPQIYAEICAVMCNTTYEYLHGEGFLDLPVSWQKQVYD